MLARTYSAQLSGLHANTITIEVDLSRGKPQLIIIGLAAKEIAESKERITTALLNSGIVPKAKKTIVNLAPAGIRKSGSKFDLAIIVAILQSYGILPNQQHKTAFFGELALDGSIRKVTGILPLILAAQREGFTQAVIPEKNAFETEYLSDVRIYKLSHISKLIQNKTVSDLQKVELKQFSTKQAPGRIFTSIKGLAEAKRALEISCAGGHSLHLIGPPGSGKSLLASASQELLPPLNKSELLEVNTIHSIAGKIQKNLQKTPPFRTPEPGVSSVTILGGGSKLLPGEITLAHKGILFLDEISEHKRSTLEALRIPLETKKVSLHRASGSIEFPAEVIFLCASNPCPCGFKYSTQKACRCSRYSLQQYQNKLSGPLQDRIDMQVFVRPISNQEILSKNKQNIVSFQQRIHSARLLQQKRFFNTKVALNAHLNSEQVTRFCFLKKREQNFLLQAKKKLGLTTRGYYKILKLSRTIADLENSAEIQLSHIAEALNYRSKKIS